MRVSSIVGKNLLETPVELKNWDNSASINPETLIRSVPAKYTFELTVEKTSPEAVLQFSFENSDGNWHDIVNEKNVSIKGGTVKDGWCIAINDETLLVTIDEALAIELECAKGIFLNGQGIILKSVKVVE